LRPFVFYALEQKHWYEYLGFDLGAFCVRCVDCRRAERRLRHRFQRYSRLTRKDDLSESELARLVSDAVFLYLTGILESEQKLRRLKNLAIARIPDDPATREIVRVISQVPKIQGQSLGRAEALMLKAVIRLIETGASVVTESQARAATLAAGSLDLSSFPSFTRAFDRLRKRRLLTWAQGTAGVFGVRPTLGAVEAFQYTSED
jgi:hypothetical protein